MSGKSRETQRRHSPPPAFAALCGILIVMAGVGVASAHSSSLCCAHMVKPVVARLTDIPSHNRVYRASLLPPGDFIELGRNPGWTLEVRTAGGALVDSAVLDLESWMPDESRARIVRPTATSQSTGVYQVDGLRFDRRGWWNVRLQIRARAGTDSLAFNLVL